MNVSVRPLAEITEHALSTLVRELGLADTARFLRQFGTGYGDYTAERNALFEDLNLKEILEQSKEYSTQENG